MEKNIQNKKDPRIALRKALFPIGLVAAILGFVWMITLLVFPFVEFKSADAYRKYVDATRYIASVVSFLSLALAALTITHAVYQLKDINKNNIKQEIVTGIINAIVGLFAFIFFLITIIWVFDEVKWAQNEGDAYAFVAVLFALAVYLLVYSRVANKQKWIAKGTNNVELRTIAVTAFMLALLVIPATFMVVIGFTTSGWDESMHSVPESIAKLNASAILMLQISKAILATITFFLLFTIPLLVVGKEPTKAIVKYSVIAGITFVFFVIHASLSSLHSDSFGERIAHLIGKGEAKTSVDGVFALLTWISSLVSGILAFVWTKKMIANKPAVNVKK